MSLLAGIIDWDNCASPVEELGALLSVLPARSVNGRFYGRVSNALLGFGARRVRAAERFQSQPLHDPRRGLFAVGDVRLDNRDELREALDGARGPSVSDLSIVVAAYERWGNDTASRLVGDFAFVIWDERRREVYAARDHFGVRSLVYAWVARRLILVTEPAQLLGLPEFDRSPNPQIVVDYLSWSYSNYGPTFFRHAHSIRPGHYLVARAGVVHETEYFEPPKDVLAYPHADDYLDQFRCIFKRSVSDRLDATDPIVAHLSGGLDSSSIVCMADRIYRERVGEVRAPLYTASAIYPGQAYDESTFIDEVLNAVGFPSHRWDGNLPSGRELTNPSLSIPGASVVFNSGTTGDIELAERLGARVILSGDPGDFVTGEFGLFNELLVRGQWSTLVRQVLAGRGEKERELRRSLLRVAIREEVPPALLRVWRAALGRSPRPRAAPPWVAGDVSVYWTQPESRNPASLHKGANRLQQKTWDYLRWARTGWLVDMFGTYAASAGAEARFPLLDVRLVRFMLSTPVEHRLLGDLRRTLHREAMSSVVPERIVRRSTKPVFNGAVVRWGHARVAAIREILEGTQWEASAFVDQGEAKALFSVVASRAPDKSDREAWVNLRAIINLETWLRAVLGYSPMEESLPMSEMKPSLDDRSGSSTRAVPEEVYVPPRVIGVGNVRDLLAAAGPSGDDNLAPAPSLGA